MGEIVGLPAKLPTGAVEIRTACRRAIDELPGIDDVGAINDGYLRQAKILEFAAREAGFRDVAYEFQRVKLSAKRRGGQVLPEWTLNGRPLKASHGVTLSELGLSREEARRWRLLARIPDDKWNEAVIDTRRPMAQSELLHLVPSTTKPSPTATVADLDILRERGVLCGTLYADPPWLYGNQGTRAATSRHYRGMTVDEIAGLYSFPDIMAPDAHLHLWTTNAFVFDAKRVMEAWGFEYKSMFVWVKAKMGIGNYWRVSHEFLLFGVRGSCPFRARNLMSWAELPRGRHSAKPEAVRAMIEAASPAPRLELFGRSAVNGWMVWGDQVERDMFTQSVQEIA